MDVYIEKPMCLTIAEGRTMVKAARKLQARHPGRHAAAVDADQQLGQRPGQERRASARSRPCWRRTSSARSAGRRPRRADVKGPVEQLVGHLDQPGRTAALRSGDPPRLGPVVGLRRRRAVLRRDRLGHPLLRPDQPRPGHRRHRPGRSPAGRAGRPIATRASSSAADGRRRRDRRHGRRRHRHRLSRHGQARRPAGQGDHEVRQRHRVASCTSTATAAPAWARSSSARRARSRSTATSWPAIPRNSSARRTTPARTSGRRPPTTSRTGSSASRAASRATPTSRSASGPRRSATWSTSSATSAASARRSKWDPVAERFTNCDEANKLLDRPRRKGYELPAIG